MDHMEDACKVPHNRCVEKHQEHIIAICGGYDNFMVDRPVQPLFTNKMMGLKNIKKLRTTSENFIDES